MSKNTGKTLCREVFLAAKIGRYRNTQLPRIPRFLRDACENGDTHTGFFIYLSLTWRYTAYKTLWFAFIVGFIAAVPLCLHGSAVKIVFCHAQTINSPIATYCVNLGLQNPLKYHKTLGRQKDVILLNIL